MTQRLFSPHIDVDHAHNQAGDTMMILEFYDSSTDEDPSVGPPDREADACIFLRPEFIIEAFPMMVEQAREALRCMATHPDLTGLDDGT